MAGLDRMIECVTLGVTYRMWHGQNEEGSHHKLGRRQGREQCAQTHPAMPSAVSCAIPGGPALISPAVRGDRNAVIPSYYVRTVSEHSQTFGTRLATLLGMPDIPWT